MGCGEGTAVAAPAAGTISFAGTLPGMGRGVTIQTADGYAVTLVQLRETAVSRGDVVDEGATVGVVVVGSPDYRPDELREFCGTPHLWVISVDPDAVALTQQGWANRRLRRSPLWRDAVALAADLDELTARVITRG